MQMIWRACFLVALTAAAAPGPARLYDITVETGMPHLEENLRYAVTRTERCLTRNDLDSVFPILQHSSLAGCRLREQSSSEDTIVYALVCESSAKTTGTATWHIGERAIRGTLDIKLGGKNMTLYQRVTGKLRRPAGDCERRGVDPKPGAAYVGSNLPEHP